MRHLILCRVILGNVEKVEAGSQQYLSSSVNVDTGSDDPRNPRWHVVWSNIANMYILPESVVSFKPFGNMQGKLLYSPWCLWFFYFLLSFIWFRS